MKTHLSPLTEADQAILRAVGRYHYLTAAQLSRLLYPKLSDENRYSQRRLKRLADGKYLLRLRALPMPRYGSPPHIFTLGRRGRAYLTDLGLSLPSYYRPSEEAAAASNNLFMQHTLAAIDVLIAADCLCRDYPVSCLRLVTERELKRSAIRVELPPGPSAEAGTPTRRVAVIPDGWFQLVVGSEPAVSIALELDRGTEDQKAWRRKVAALALWAAGPYQAAFATDNLTIAVVCLDPRRRVTLARWTLAELTSRDLMALADIFLFTAADPVTTSPAGFFFGRRWHLLGNGEAVSLLDPLEESGVVDIGG